MRPKRAILAKLSRPGLHRPVPRPRLFALLDQYRRERRATCIVGPPGAGKTTLAASWLHARDLPGIWVQIDEGDADLATFFYYLTLAADPFKRHRQRGLPPLLPEYLSDVSGFARRFFRAFFARLPAEAVVTFDNYQEAGVDEAFHRIVALAIEEAPPGIGLLAISRHDPPACYARLLANGNVAVLDWEQLKLDPSEADAIADCHGLEAPNVSAALRDITDGWAAGLVLALEGGGLRLDPARIPDSALDATFNYFASEIFCRVPHETQQFLMRTSVLDDVPVSLAERLTGEARAGAILEELYRRHLFTYRKPGREPVYWYHTLFRNFLALQAACRLSAAERDDNRKRASALLETQSPGAALVLYCESGAWDEAERVIVRHAETLIAQGRWKVVVDDVGRLPADKIESSRWLSCWLGVALTAVHPAAARDHLERSFHLAAKHDDPACRVRAASAVIQSHLLEYNAFRPLDRWVDALLDAIPGSRFASPEAEMMAHASVVTAFAFRQLARPELARSALRVFDLLPQVQDVNLRLSAACAILAWGSLTGPIDMAHRALPIAESLWRHPLVTPLNAAVAGHLISWYHCFIRNRPACEAVLRTLLEIQDRDGLTVAGAYAATIGVLLECFDGNMDAAMRWLDLLERSAARTSPFDRAMLMGMKGWLCMARGESTASLEYSLKSVSMFDELGSVFHQIGTRQNLIWHHIKFAAFDQARQRIEECRRLMTEFATYRYELDARVAEASIALRTENRAACEIHLRSALAFARSRGLDHEFIELRHVMPELCGVALEADIETPYVRRLVRHFDWPVPPSRLEAWPWQVRVHTFGGLRVLVRDAPLTFAGKAPRKPIALLEAILAFGCQGIPTAKLTDVLWPDEDGDIAYHSFGLAMHRLRKLLGGADTVSLDLGKVSLNPMRVWTDVEAFELQAAGALEGGEPAGVLHAYRGQFLSDSDEHHWVISARDRWHQRYIDTVCTAARRGEASGQWDHARAWYERALAVDPMCEAFVQGLIRCQLASGDFDRAREILERLEARLRAASKGPPSRKTVALVRGLSPHDERDPGPNDR